MNRAAQQTKFMLRLMLGIIVLCIGMGFLSLFLQERFSNQAITAFEKQIENDKNRIHIGRYIIDDLSRLRKSFYGTLAVFNQRSESHLINRIQDISDELMQALDVIEKGGDFAKEIPLNLPEQDSLVDRVAYHPVGHDRYIEEIMVLRVLISDIVNTMVPELRELLDQRQSVHSGTNTSPKKVATRMNTFFNKLDPQFNRMEEYANKLFYDSTIHMEKVKQQIASREQQFFRLTAFSSVAIVLIIIFLGLVISRSIIAKTMCAIRDEEKKFRAIADFSNDWDEWLLPDKTYKYVSPACEIITGYSREEFFKNPDLVNEIVHPEDQKKLCEHRHDHFDPDSPQAEVNFRIIHKDGTNRWIWHQCRPLFTPEGTWCGRRASNRDVTSLHISQKNLKMNEQRLKLALQCGELGLWDWNIETGEFLCNKRWFEMLEYEPWEIEVNLESWKKMLHPDDFSKVTEKVDQHLQGESEYFEAEYRLQTKSKCWVWCLSKGKVIDCDNTGKPLRAVGTHLDITDRKERESKEREFVLQQEKIQRLKSIDIIAGAIAHRFNNAMMAVVGNLDLLHLTLPNGSPEKAMAASAQQAAKGASRIGTMMLTYVGQGTQHLSSENFVELVQETLTELKDQFMDSIMVKFIPPPGDLFCVIDKKQLKEVIISIITNSVESMGNPGEHIEISFGEDHFSRDSFPMIFQADKPADGVYVYCQISDTGCGIHQDDLTHIFEPFVTTKFVGRGLGLAMATGVMRSHHGALTVESTSDKGTTVRVLLPSLSQVDKA